MTARKLLIAAASIAVIFALWSTPRLYAGHGDGSDLVTGNGKHKGHKGRGKQKKAESVEEALAEDAGRFKGPFFTPQNAALLTSYYSATQLSHLPPGLRKHIERTGHLPPGLEKHLARNGQLPPGLQKRLNPLPPDLVRRLGPLPVGTRLYLYNRDILLLNAHTNAVVDILRDVLGGAR